MKRSKILVLVAALLVAVMALTACAGKGKAAFSDYINTEYDTATPAITAGEKISAIKDYTFVSANGYIAVFSTIDEEEETVTYKLVNLADASVIATISKEDTLSTFAPYGPAYLVASVTATEDTEPVTKYALYDVTGTAIAKSDDAATAEVLNGGEFLVYDRVIYDINAKGELTKMVDVPEYVSVEIELISENYFYSALEESGIVVYDREFNYVSYYQLPSYAEDQELFLLDNGDYIVQYRVALDSESAKYDIYSVEDGVTSKFDLVTLLVSAADGSAKELKFDYIIEELNANSDLYDAEEENNMFLEDSFENIVILIPIEDGKVNDAEFAAEIRFMDNKGKLGDSLKVFDDMMAYGVPNKIADNVYVSYGATGFVLLNGEGEIIKRITNTSFFNIVGGYFVGDDAIYSADLSETVYDLKKNEVEDTLVIGDSLLMQIELDDGNYKVVLFADGKETAIYNSETMDTKEFFVIEEIDGYCIYDQADDKYAYYNAKGEKVLTTEEQVTFLASGEDTVIGVAIVDGEAIYYFFK